MCRRISIGLWHNSVLALAPTNPWKVVCKSIGCIRVAWCNTFSGHVFAVWISCRRAHINAKSCQRITPVFCGLCCTIVTCFDALLRHLTSKVTIGTSEWAHSGERISVDWLVSRAFCDTEPSQVVSVWICWTSLDAFVSWVVSPVFFGTFLNASAILFIAITEIRRGYWCVSCDIRTSTDTLSSGGISKEASSLTIEFTDFVLVVVIRYGRTS